MNNAWENLNKTWKERLEKLEDAMQAAVQYQDTLQVRTKGDHHRNTASVMSYSESSLRVGRLYRTATLSNLRQPPLSVFLSKVSHF